MITAREAPVPGAGGPLYLQIVESLREKIGSGEYAPGTLLPSEIALTKIFAVSRVTVRQALAELEERGLIYRQQGRGTFVSEPSIRQQINHEAQTIVEALRNEGIEPEVRVLGLDQKKPNHHVAAILGTGDQDICILKRLYLHNKLPIALSTLNLPLSMGGIASILSRQQNINQTTYSIFESMGLVIKEAKHVIKTIALDTTEAKHLRLNAGDICLASERITYGRNGSPLELTQFVYPPERMRFEITLPRHSAAKVLRVYSQDRN